MSRQKKADSPDDYLSEMAQSTYRILHDILGISPPMRVHLLTESEWKQKFQGQPYGDPVAPGDGGIYYGNNVPINWQRHFTDFSKFNLKYKDVIQSDLNLIFYCTASHEVGHLFSNDLSSPKVLEQIEIDFSGDGIETLWFYELFSQYSMIMFLNKSNHPYKKIWLDFYRWFHDSKIDEIKYRRMDSWGVDLLKWMREDVENASGNYLWFQAKSYLLCEEVLEVLGDEAFIGLASAVKSMPYPITTSKMVRHVDDNVPGFSKIWAKWK
ncbi:MAG: hypothetical protein KKH41_02890 [Candidatus Thermoplasmatota archaeon]|nr:hypothetical protein [Euryarchaeota archaeon]MBU4070819.1 hypothetical protein [Candidatus Thermoplasmatota archaeon]MBU4144198.1 hypothetical protein [Candidatus Thermoplasmatota archaeon]MBU4591510.1 hypothetical protein [Candidatus Thermoplasmatota archaeon]